MKINVVVTTIHELNFLDTFYDNIEKYNIKDNINFIVVLDNKQPKKIYTGDKTLAVEVWQPYEQERWLKAHGIKHNNRIIPENSPRRRNFGYLRSLSMEPDLTIVIDDDNLAYLDDFFGCHKYPYERGTDRFPLVSSRNKMVDHCKTTIMNHKDIYGRGYPLGEWYNDTWHCWGPKIYDCDHKKVAMHMGLWMNKPDVDAISNISYPDLEVSGRYQYSPYYELDTDNYISVNTQNTSFNKDVAKVFWNVHQPDGCNRFDDIWNGLFIQKIAHRRGEAVTFGVPYTNHDRNTHDYAYDLQQEMVGLLSNTALWKFVMNLRLESKNYLDAYLEIAEAIERNDVTKNYRIELYMKDLAKSMKEWVDVVDKVI